MAKVEVSESSHLNFGNGLEEDEIGEVYDDKGYSKIPLDQINLNTEPISITNEYNHPFLGINIKSYIKVFFGFLAVLILLILISILTDHFHHDKIEPNNSKLIANNQNKGSASLKTANQLGINIEHSKVINKNDIKKR